jgi:hypothetical protein
MAQQRSLRRLIAAAISFALFVLFAPVLVADGGDATLIHACVKKVNGQLRIVQPSETCLPAEISVHWPASTPANAAGSIMVHGGGFGVGGAPVNFVHYGAGVPVYRSPRAGVIQNMRILVTTNTYNGSTPVTLMVNGVATTLSTVIAAGSTANIDVPGTVNIVDGDQISIVLDRGASSAGFLELSIAYEVL